MKPKILVGLYCALATCVGIHAESENDVTRGTYPFMAFIYYPDEKIVDATGSRFVRGAVLIRSDWLVSSAIAPNDPNGFPRKTLLARAGAVTIDANFTLNEDEHEQEREIIQIVRPYNHSATQWWRTDISLMKTLLPFNLTSAVGITTMNPKHDYMDKTCMILVYVRRFGNWTQDKLLMQIYVELLPPSIINCGSHFTGNSMTCAADSDEHKQSVHDASFCHGNSGGPLICENQVMGLQTYIDNNCKQPHLYQLLAAWDNFISCGTEDKCQEEECANICDVTNKDAPTTTIEEMKISSEYITSAESVDDTTIATTASTEVTTVANDISDVPEFLTPTLTSTFSPEITTSEQTAYTPPTTTTTSTMATTRTTESTSETESDIEVSSWPKEKEDDKKIDDEEQDNARKANLEAQELKSKESNIAVSKMSNCNILFFLSFIMLCLI